MERGRDSEGGREGTYGCVYEGEEEGEKKEGGMHSVCDCVVGRRKKRERETSGKQDGSAKLTWPSS